MIWMQSMWKKSGLSDDLMAQFMNISKALEKEKSEGNER